MDPFTILQWALIYAALITASTISGAVVRRRRVRDALRADPDHYHALIDAYERTNRELKANEAKLRDLEANRPRISVPTPKRIPPKNPASSSRPRGSDLFDSRECPTCREHEDMRATDFRLGIDPGPSISHADHTRPGGCQCRECFEERKAIARRRRADNSGDEVAVPAGVGYDQWLADQEPTAAEECVDVATEYETVVNLGTGERYDVLVNRHGFPEVVTIGADPEPVLEADPELQTDAISQETREAKRRSRKWELEQFDADLDLLERSATLNRQADPQKETDQ